VIDTELDSPRYFTSDSAACSAFLSRHLTELPGHTHLVFADAGCGRLDETGSATDGSSGRPVARLERWLRMRYSFSLPSADEEAGKPCLIDGHAVVQVSFSTIRSAT